MTKSKYFSGVKRKQQSWCVGDEAEVLFDDGVWHSGVVTSTEEQTVTLHFPDGDTQACKGDRATSKELTPRSTS